MAFTPWTPLCFALPPSPACPSAKTLSSGLAGLLVPTLPLGPRGAHVSPLPRHPGCLLALPPPPVEPFLGPTSRGWGPNPSLFAFPQNQGQSLSFPGILENIQKNLE